MRVDIAAFHDQLEYKFDGLSAQSVEARQDLAAVKQSLKSDYEHLSESYRDTSKRVEIQMQWLSDQGRQITDQRQDIDELQRDVAENRRKIEDLRRRLMREVHRRKEIVEAEVRSKMRAKEAPRKPSQTQGSNQQ